MAGPTQRRRACQERFGVWGTLASTGVSVRCLKNFLRVQVRIDGSKKPPSGRSAKPFAVSVLCTLDFHDWIFSSMCHKQNRAGNLKVSDGHRPSSAERQMSRHHCQGGLEGQSHCFVPASIHWWCQCERTKTRSSLARSYNVSTSQM